MSWVWSCHAHWPCGSINDLLLEHQITISLSPSPLSPCHHFSSFTSTPLPQRDSLKKWITLDVKSNQILCLPQMTLDDLGTKICLKLCLVPISTLHLLDNPTSWLRKGPSSGRDWPNPSSQHRPAWEYFDLSLSYQRFYDWWMFLWRLMAVRWRWPSGGDGWWHKAFVCVCVCECVSSQGIILARTIHHARTMR